MTIRIITAHVLDGLAMLPAESVHCVVTSPPYYGLRDYGIEPQVWGGDPNGSEFYTCEDCGITKCISELTSGCPECGQTMVPAACEHEWGAEGKSEQRLRNGIGSDTAKVAFAETLHPSTGAFCRRCNTWAGSLGLEPTLDLYLDHMVEVFRAVRRVLRKDGTCWLSIGDSYAGGGRGGNPAESAHRKQATNTGSVTGITKSKWPHDGFKPKDLMLIPSRLAIRLQDAGWWVRSDIAWCKKAPMPESCTDRPTAAWEHVFLLTKSAKYFYDAEAVKEEAERAGDIPGGNYASRLRPHETLVSSSWAIGKVPARRNMRNFWLLGPSPYPEAHFATFPPEIPRRAVLAGTSERGVCPKCGAPWARVLGEKTLTPAHDGQGSRNKISDADWKDGWEGVPRMSVSTETIGWRPTCGCELPMGVDALGKWMGVMPATILDPFLGAGTTALVADQLRRNCIGIELSPKYAEMARLRITEDNSLFSEIAAE